MADVLDWGGEERLTSKVQTSRNAKSLLAPIACSHFEQVMRKSIFNQYDRASQANITPAGGAQ